MRTTLPALVGALAIALSACEWSVATECADEQWDPTILTCESVTEAAQIRLAGVVGVTAVRIIGPEGCPPGGRGCAFPNDVAIVVAETASGRELSFVVTVEAGQGVAGPIEEFSPMR